MREPPTHVTNAEVLDAVQASWLPEADAVEHLPVGFGAHHWAASVGPDRELFVTFDGLLPRHTARSLEGAYAAAATLAAAGLDFVVAPVPSASGSHTVPLAVGMLSATRWVDGRVAGGGLLDDPSSARTSLRMLARLHAAEPPAGIPAWAPLVQADFAHSLASRLAGPWDAGPFAARARDALSDRNDAIARWSRRTTGWPTRPATARGYPHLAQALQYLLSTTWERLPAPYLRDCPDSVIPERGCQAVDGNGVRRVAQHTGVAFAEHLEASQPLCKNAASPQVAGVGRQVAPPIQHASDEGSSCTHTAALHIAHLEDAQAASRKFDRPVVPNLHLRGGTRGEREVAHNPHPSAGYVPDGGPASAVTNPPRYPRSAPVGLVLWHY